MSATAVKEESGRYDEKVNGDRDLDHDCHDHGDVDVDVNVNFTFMEESKPLYQRSLGTATCLNYIFGLERLLAYMLFGMHCHVTSLQLI